MGKRKKKRKAKWIALSVFCCFTFILAGLIVLLPWQKQMQAVKPEELLKQYISCIEKQDYERMYSMLEEQSKQNISQTDFISRNQKIYEGIEVKDMKIKITGRDESEKNRVILNYQISFNSVAGKVSFDNQAVYTKEKKKGYALIWDDSMIFPQLTFSDKVKVLVDAAERGQILDRNDRILAGEGTASSVGLIPGKMNTDSEQDMKKIAELLGISVESIQKKRMAKWVKEDSFVPIKTIKKVKDTDLLTDNPSEETLKNKALQDELLTIPGVMISNVNVRAYPFGKMASHLTGYVQNVTAEDLKKHQNEGYRSNSVIGRTGLEGLYEKELKGKDGYKIVIVDAQGDNKYIVADLPKEDGENIKLTIDSGLQKLLYEEFGEDESCHIAMNPYTGEVLALVSTPSFDSNDFILGLSEQQWKDLNDDRAKPLYNRFRQSWCPGSSFKPVTAAIGLMTGAIDPEEDYGNAGLSWQKDSSWGNYYVTTLHSYQPVILENALIHSDNIYFAKAALKIGTENLEKKLEDLGFHSKLPFEITMSKSQYANKGKIKTEIQLADSGYGQGEILINPLHLASIYTAFLNEGTIIKPELLYKQQPKSEVWIPDAFSSEAANEVKTALVKVVNNPQGTGYAARREDILLAGKTGTAEIKTSKSDTKGTELGWFGVFTAEETVPKPILLMSMVEDVKDRGGSSYVVKKDKAVLDQYLKKGEN